MPKFVQEILDNLDFDFDFEIEIPDFPSGSEEEIRIPDAFVPDNIETM